MSNDLLKLLFYSQKQITYMPELVPIAGGVNATILLLRLLYWHTKQEGKTFYKFEKACKHEAYRAGDSWTEELGFSVEEFRNARAKIGTKVSKPFGEKLPSQTITGEYLGREHLVYYYTDYTRKTWYSLNIDLLVYYLGQQLEGKNMPPDPRLKKVVERTDTPTDTEDTNQPKTGNFTLLEEKVKDWVKVVHLQPAIVKTLNTALEWYDPRTETKQFSTPNQLYDNDPAYRDWINQEVELGLKRVAHKKSGRIGYTKVSERLTQFTVFSDFIRKDLKKYLLKKDIVEKDYVPVVPVEDEDEDDE